MIYMLKFQSQPSKNSKIQRSKIRKFKIQNLKKKFALFNQTDGRYTLTIIYI